MNFRVYDTHTKTLISNFIIDERLQVRIVTYLIINEDGYTYETYRPPKDQYRVDRFTGLFDKNGKGIYENDYISFQCMDYYDETTFYPKELVMYSNDYAGFTFGDNEIGMWDRVVWETLEVIND